MTILQHELRQGRRSFLIWTLCIAFFIAICVFMFPEMKTEMDDVTNMFSSMGSFTKAFGMDRLNFGTLIGFYSVECGNILGLGGAFYAALLAVSVLAKEEKEHTAEFLFTHPISRARILTEKLLAVFVQITLLNVVVLLFSVSSIAIIGESAPWKDLLLLHFAFLLMQYELAGICFAISAIARRGSAGIGLGLATFMYALNLMANISESVKFLKYITPFGYTESADILANHNLDSLLVLIGMCFMIIGIVSGYLVYLRKDLR